jgi:hypothetical protein
VNAILFEECSLLGCYAAWFLQEQVSEERIASIIRATKIGELGTLTANVAPSWPIVVTLMMDELRSFETSVLRRVAGHKISEDGILHSHHRENHNPYEIPFALSPHLGRAG